MIYYMRYEKNAKAHTTRFYKQVIKREKKDFPKNERGDIIWKITPSWKTIEKQLIKQWKRNRNKKYVNI